MTTAHRRHDGRACCHDQLPEPVYAIAFRPGPEFAWKNHRPISLADAWQELEGTACVGIISPVGRVIARRGYGGWEYLLPDGSYVDREELRRHLSACNRRSRMISKDQVRVGQNLIVRRRNTKTGSTMTVIGEVLSVTHVGIRLRGRDNNGPVDTHLAFEPGTPYLQEMEIVR